MLGEELHGITDYYIIKDEDSSSFPNVIMLLGEVHGKQTCGESDYVSAYKRFLDYNESNNKAPIDIFIESVNVENLIIPHGKPYNQWMDELRQFFQDCFLYYQRDSKKCKYTTARFHWADPRINKEEWLRQGETIPFTAPDNWREVYPEIAKHLQTKDDLIKIILENSFIRKNGERCKIPNWEQLVKLQFNDIYENEFKPIWKTWRWNEDEWWKHGIFHTFRLVQDVYVFLRMFRHPKQQLEKWEETNRFTNIIYHAGARHIQYIKRMLLNYKGTFRVLRETHSTDKECSRVNFMDFLNIIEEKDKHSVYNSHQGPHNEYDEHDDYTRMLSGNMSNVGVGGRIKKRHAHFRYKSQKKCNSRKLRQSCKYARGTKRAFCRRRTNKNYRS
jgi:hypothetical protein